MKLDYLSYIYLTRNLCSYHHLPLTIQELREDFPPKKPEQQAGAELAQAQPKLGFWENDLSLRNYIWGWGWMARGLK